MRRVRVYKRSVPLRKSGLHFQKVVVKHLIQHNKKKESK